MIDTDGTITTVAGGGDTPSAEFEDGAAATGARLGHVSYVVVDSRGDVIFSDFFENFVWMIDPDGAMSRVAGTGTPGFYGDAGPAVDAELNFPTGLALDAEGNLYISDAGNHVIRMIDRRGVITTIAGTGDQGSGGLGGPAVDAQLNAPAGIAINADGLLYISDQGNDRILRVNAQGDMELIAGAP